ncbi:uncharacterized protein LOC134241735 [Saccostrea cucullata]|uniref:uncharacterized protein LOC134241735 n=1 Tax=Saccostrea cuccullata TaxID=36930 RepID=UPI002ED0B1EE
MANILFSDTVDQNTKDSLLQNICINQQENTCSPSTSKLPESVSRNEFLDMDSTSDVFDPDKRKEELNNPCTSASRAITSGTSEKTSKWTQAAEKLLLSKHRDLEESKLPIKNKWKKISDDMHSNNYDFSPKQCRLKIKTIKEKYERNKKKKQYIRGIPC